MIRLSKTSFLRRGNPIEVTSTWSHKRLPLRVHCASVLLAVLPGNVSDSRRLTQTTRKFTNSNKRDPSLILSVRINSLPSSKFTLQTRPTRIGSRESVNRSLANNRQQGQGSLRFTRSHFFSRHHRRLELQTRSSPLQFDAYTSRILRHPSFRIGSNGSSPIFSPSLVTLPSRKWSDFHSHCGNREVSSHLQRISSIRGSNNNATTLLNAAIIAEKTQQNDLFNFKS